MLITNGPAQIHLWNNTCHEDSILSLEIIEFPYFINGNLCLRDIYYIIMYKYLII